MRSFQYMEEFALCGVQPTCREFYENLFTGNHITYDVAKCRMVVAVVNLDDSWSSYVWDFVAHRLSILDPSMCESTEQTIYHKHKGMAPTLLGSMLKCMELYCGKEVGNIYNCDILLARKFIEAPQIERSGLYSLYCASEFNGVTLSREITEDQLLQFRSHLLWHLLSLPSNNGYVPTVCRN
ncbi:hypothetical protein ACP70R_009279 [Stipagrostis hirtigluma subsp. patula]